MKRWYFFEFVKTKELRVSYFDVATTISDIEAKGFLVRAYADTQSILCKHIYHDIYNGEFTEKYVNEYISDLYERRPEYFV